MKALILTALLVACGELPKDIPVQTAPVAASPVATTEEAAPAVVKESVSSNSYFLKTRADLWECTDKVYRQLVYVEEESTFYHCDKRDWVSIDLKGEKGEAAEAVTATAETKAARDGKDGKDGRDGHDGKDAPYIGPDEWVDPVSGYKWYLGMSISRMDVRDFDELCAEGGSPTEDELKAARKSGLNEQFAKNLTGSWGEWFWIGLDKDTYGFKVGVITNICVNAGCNGAGMNQRNPVNYYQDSNAKKTFHRTLCVIK